MTRKEGIIRQYKKPENSKILAAAGGTIEKVVKVEYDNYTELCHYCSEQPLSFDEWTNQTIKQAEK